MPFVSTFISAVLKQKWINEFETISRDHIQQFIKWSFDNTIVRNAGSDHLFTEDFNYSSASGKTDEERNEMEKHKNITKIDSLADGNPFNIEFECQPFTYAIIKLWNYFIKFETNLSSIEISKTAVDHVDFYYAWDQTALWETNKPNFTGNRIKLMNPLPQNLQPFEPHFLVFYKLKSYFYAFGIQTYLLESFGIYLKEMKLHKEIICNAFTHIWNNEYIERQSTITGNPKIFTSNTTNIENRIQSFYRTFWGIPSYESNPNLTPDQIMNEVINQYLKLYYFQQNNGINRLRFKSLLNNYSYSLNTITTNAETLLQDFVKTFYSIVENQYTINGQNITIFETLIYWLVCGTCFMVFRQSAYLLKFIYRLKNIQLVRDKKHFFLTKAGIIEVFKAKEFVNNIIIELKNKFIHFDDIFERISNALDKTMYLIKILFRNYYKMLANNWFEELNEIYDKHHQNSESAIKLHLISGIAFIIAFNNDNRFDSFRFRLYLSKLRDKHRIGTNPTEDAFNQIWDLCDTWLSTQIDELDIRQSLVCQYWTPHINAIITQLPQSQQILNSYSQWISGADQT